MPEAVKTALPAGFNERRYIAKFINGELVELRKGLPEEAILAVLPNPAETPSS